MAEQSLQPSSSQPEQSQGSKHIVSSADQVVSGSVRHASESDSQTEQALRETKSEQTGERQCAGLTEYEINQLLTDAIGVCGQFEGDVTCSACGIGRLDHAFNEIMAERQAQRKAQR